MTLRMLMITGEALSSAVNAHWGDGKIGDGSSYLMARIINDHPSMSFTAGKFSTRPDPAGGGFAICLLDGGTARSKYYSYGWPDASLGAYSTPTDPSTGLTLPTLAADQQVLVGIRRNLSSGTSALPEMNVLRVDGTVPIGYY